MDSSSSASDILPLFTLSYDRTLLGPALDFRALEFVIARDAWVGVEVDGVAISGELAEGETMGFLTFVPFFPGVNIVAVFTASDAFLSVRADRLFGVPNVNEGPTAISVPPNVESFRLIGERSGDIVKLYEYTVGIFKEINW